MSAWQAPPSITGVAHCSAEEQVRPGWQTERVVQGAPTAPRAVHVPAQYEPGAHALEALEAPGPHPCPIGIVAAQAPHPEDPASGTCTHEPLWHWRFQVRSQGAPAGSVPVFGSWQVVEQSVVYARAHASISATVVVDPGRATWISQSWR